MSDITNKLASMTKSAGKATGDLFKTTKLNLSLSGEQSALNKLYTEIGKKVHEIYKYGGSLGELFDKFYVDIQAHEAKMADLKTQIAVIRGIRECPHCSKPVERTSEFCSKCGTALVPIHAEGDMPDPADETLPYAGEAPPTPYMPPAPPTTPPQPYHPAQIPPAATSLPHTPPAAAPAPPIPASPSIATSTPATRTCRVCNTVNDAATKFCLSCGRIVD